MFVLAREGSLLFSYFDLKMFAPSAEGFYTRIGSSPRWPPTSLSMISMWNPISPVTT